MEPRAYCGISEDVVIGANGMARLELAQQAEKEKTSPTDAGAILLSWSLNEECLNQTADLDQTGPSLYQAESESHHHLWKCAVERA